VLRWRIDFTDAACHLSGSRSPEQAKISQARSFLVPTAPKGYSRRRAEAVAVAIPAVTLCRHSAAGSAILAQKMCLPGANFADEGLVFPNI